MDYFSSRFFNPDWTPEPKLKTIEDIQGLERLLATTEDYSSRFILSDVDGLVARMMAAKIPALPPANVRGIVVDDTDTIAVRDTNIRDLDTYAVSGGNVGVAYHFLIRTNGEAEIGRPIGWQGNHLPGYNETTIGIVLEGGRCWTGQRQNTFTGKQYCSLKQLVAKLVGDFGDVPVLTAGKLHGFEHRLIPGFDAAEAAGTGEVQAQAK